MSGLPAWETVFTAMFMHASILHIAGNMLFLWIFGNNVEDSMGPVRFLGFYLLGGVAALALQVAVGPNTVDPTVGASGAIAAVLGGYIVLYPRARVLTLVLIIFFFGVIELPALVMLGVWFAEQAVFGAAGPHRHRPTRRRGGLLRPRRRLRLRPADHPAGGHAAQADAPDRGGLSMRLVLLVRRGGVHRPDRRAHRAATSSHQHGVSWLDVLAILIVSSSAPGSSGRCCTGATSVRRGRTDRGRRGPGPAGRAGRFAV